MNTYDDLEKKALNGEITVLDYICAVTDEDAKNNNTGLTTARIEAAYWKSVRNAGGNGKKLVAFSGSIPAEIFYALDCVPLCVDAIPPVLTKSTELTSKLIYNTDVHINSALCSHSKSMLSAALTENSGFAPDALVCAAVSCPSFSTAQDALMERVKIPTYNVSTPYRMNERTVELCAHQVRELAAFLEELTGNRLDGKTLQRYMEQSNRTKLALDRCSDMRKYEPCPMSSRIMELGRLMPVLAPTKDMEVLLQEELSSCEALAENKYSPCSSGEKHRVFLLQNPIWCGSSIIEWLEREYGAVTVMDGLCYEHGVLYKNTESLDDCILELTEKLFVPPVLHSAATPAKRILELTEDTIRDYGVDVCLFLGSVGCRHAWAVSKMLTDDISKKFGIPTLFADVDSVDAHYKDVNQIKTQIAEFMDTVVNGK